ncbi:MAG: BatA domain-containing protein, partial [Planctomycetes bacterium]|nr:BatA domain-containing protein [Planctomycetota bacterium]
MLAVLTFAAPSLLIGLAAGLVPVLIHALLRPKARRLRFPPVRFFAEALASGQRAQRVRDGWLLALRAAAVCLAALLLAAPTCRQAASVEDANAPIAAAIILDDSWSTRYQVDAAAGELDLAIAAADATATAAQGWPAPSLLGLFQADPSASDVSQIRDRLRRIAAAAPHAAALGRAIQNAAAELASARPNRRRLLVYTDLAAHAWRDVPGGVLHGVEHLDVRIVSPYRERRTNLAILAAAAPEQVHPQTAEVPIHAELLAEGIAQSATLTAGSGGESRARISPIELAPDQPQGVDILLPPTAAGVHGVRIEAAPADRLPFDQVRYAAWEAGPRANVWLLSQAADAADADLTTTIYRNLLAPELLPASQHPVVLECFDPKSIARKLESQAGPRPDLIIALPTTELSDAARQGLLKLSEAGAVLLLAAGSSERLTDWPGLRRVFSPDPPTCEPTDATAVAWSQSSPFAGDNPGLRDIPGCAVRRRIILSSLADGTTVHASFGDGRPAIVSRRHGRGEIFLLATSPDPVWSELGIRAAGLLSWLDALVMRT